MARYEITGPDGAKWEINAPDDATEDAVMAYAQQQWGAQQKPPDAETAAAQVQQPKEEGFGARLSRELSSIPRQAGLFTRYAIEGPAEMAKIGTEPIRYLMNMIPGVNIPPGNAGTTISDAIGLPSPQGTTEETIGSATRLMAGTGGLAALAGRGASNAASGVARGVLERMASAPAQQFAGAAGAGAAGEYTKQTGGGPGAQFVASLIGGLGGAAGMAGAQGIGRSMNAAVRRLATPAPTTEQVTLQLNKILADNDLNVSAIPPSVRGEMLKEVQNALSVGQQVNPQVLKRLADYGVVGATPTRGSVTLDPVQITQERNLAKIGANSTDERMQQLARLQRQNDLKLTENLNTLGAEKAVDPLTAGTKLVASLKAIDAPRKAAVDEAYQAVRDASGRYANLDVPAFSKLANAALDEQQLGSVLPQRAVTMLNDVSTGKIPLNVNTAVQIDKRLSGMARDAAASGDKEGALAIRQIRTALNQTPVENTAGQEALTLYDKARQMAAQRFAAIEKNPAMSAALDDVAPDKFVQTYIVGEGGKANVRDVVRLARELKTQPDAFQSAREQIVYSLKNKALSGNADEVGNFSPSQYNKALRAIGDAKLKLFFSPDEINQIKAVGRVASYEKFQPSGSAVNNSNTASALAGMLERVANSPLVSRIPFGASAIKAPAEAWVAQLKTERALTPMQALVQEAVKTKPDRIPPSALMLLPYIQSQQQ